MGGPQIGVSYPAGDRSKKVQTDGREGNPTGRPNKFNPVGYREKERKGWKKGERRERSSEQRKSLHKLGI